MTSLSLFAGRTVVFSFYHTWSVMLACPLTSPTENDTRDSCLSLPLVLSSSFPETWSDISSPQIEIASSQIEKVSPSAGESIMLSTSKSKASLSADDNVMLSASRSKADFGDSCLSLPLVIDSSFPVIVSELPSPKMKKCPHLQAIVWFHHWQAGLTAVMGSVMERIASQDDIGPVKQVFFWRKIAIIYLSIILIMCFGCSKEPSH